MRPGLAASPDGTADPWAFPVLRTPPLPAARNRAGPGTEHAPGTTRPTSSASNPRVLSQGAISCRNGRSGRSPGGSAARTYASFPDHRQSDPCQRQPWQALAEPPKCYARLATPQRSAVGVCRSGRSCADVARSPMAGRGVSYAAPVDTAGGAEAAAATSCLQGPHRCSGESLAWTDGRSQCFRGSGEGTASFLDPLSVGFLCGAMPDRRAAPPWSIPARPLVR